MFANGFLILYFTFAITIINSDIPANPAGELLKVALASRIPSLAVCGTDSHCKKLEIMMTEFVFEEQQRDGSTFYIPEMKIAKAEEEKPLSSAKGKAKAKPKSAPNKREAAGKDGEEDGVEPKPKKPRKNKNQKKEDDDEGSEASGSSMPW